MRNPDPACPACGASLPAARDALESVASCTYCQREVITRVLPAFGRGPAAGARPEKTTGDDEAACFFHPAKRAVVPCDRCGRFLCALCDLPVANEHVCPECMQAKARADGFAGIARPRLRWDTLGWYVVLLPLFLCYVATPLTGLAAAGIAAWGLRKPPSRVANSRAHLVAILVLGLALCGGGIAMWIALIDR